MVTPRQTRLFIRNGQRLDSLVFITLLVVADDVAVLAHLAAQAAVLAVGLVTLVSTVGLAIAPLRGRVALMSASNVALPVKVIMSTHLSHFFRVPETSLIASLSMCDTRARTAQLHALGALAITWQPWQLCRAQGLVATASQTIGTGAAILFIAAVQTTQVGGSITNPPVEMMKGGTSCEGW